jgi:hypothetical protein
VAVCVGHSIAGANDESMAETPASGGKQRPCMDGPCPLSRISQDITTMLYQHGHVDCSDSF